MQKTIPSLDAYPLDDVSAYTIWNRLSPDSLADIIPYLTNARRDSFGVRYFDLPNANIRRFTADQREQEGGPNSPIYDMLMSPGHLYQTVPALRQSIGGIAVEVCYEAKGEQPSGLLKITGGNKDLNSRD